MKHISDEALERYVMLPPPQHRISRLEDHLSACVECRDRHQGQIDFVTAMRGAARKIREKERVEGSVEVRAFTAGEGG